MAKRKGKLKTTASYKPKPKKKYKYTEEQKLIKRVNQNLVRLERKGFDTYAVKQLRERMKDLNAWTAKGRVRTSVPEFDDKEKKAFLKALKYFESSATSTVGKTKKLEPELMEIFKTGKIRKTNKETGEIEEVEITANEQQLIESLFELEETESFMKSFEYEDIINFNEFILEARNGNIASQEDFISQFEANFLVTDDKDLKSNLASLYNKLTGNF